MSEPVIETQQAEIAPTEEPADTFETRADTYEAAGFPTEDIPTDVTTPAPPPETEEPPVTSVVTTTVTTTTATTAATTTTLPVTKPPEPSAPVIIPDVRTVSCPGTAVTAADVAVLDHSNASLGYIGAKYSGSSARAKLRIICGDVTYDHDLAVGGVTEYFPLSQGSGDYSVQIYEQIEGRNYSPVFDQPAAFRAADGNRQDR